jgi:hypothetical protein
MDKVLIIEECIHNYLKMLKFLYLCKNVSFYGLFD